LQHALLRVDHSYTHYLKTKSNYQNKLSVSTTAKEQLEKRFHAVIYECNSVLTFSDHQIDQISRAVRSLLSIVRQETTGYIFSSSSTVHFFPREVIPYLETLLSPSEQGGAGDGQGPSYGDVETKPKRRKKKRRKKSQHKNMKKGSQPEQLSDGRADDEALVYSESESESEREEDKGREKGSGLDTPAPLHMREKEDEGDDDDDVFQLTTLDEDPFGHLREFLLHSESDIDQTQDRTADSGARDEDDEVYQIDFDSEDDEDLLFEARARAEEGDEERLQQKQTTERVVQFSLPESTRPKEKVKKKKLARWNPEPCSQCNRSFRGQGKNEASACLPCLSGLTLRPQERSFQPFFDPQFELRRLPLV
jgi:hypothetical protein